MKRFPCLITFTIDEASHSVIILRVFNTYLPSILTCSTTRAKPMTLNWSTPSCAIEKEKRHNNDSLATAVGA
jgi:hypothetical protein